MTGTPLGPRFHAALVYASAFFGDRRRGNTHVPAIAHAMAVCALVLDLSPTEDEAIAALLHDVVEDHGGRPELERIRTDWGDVVADLVEELSDEVEPSGRSWMELKAAALDRMVTESPAALRIALADKSDNACTLVRAYDAEGPALMTSHAAGSRDALLWYYEALVELFEQRRPDLGTEAWPLLREFSTAVALLRERSAAAPHPLGSST
ncbi:MAG: HD domain-containing protein [Solirubrobacteraceae bacterium]|nr:HD domain-containing protein [Solirubrobacteraceae bacterium]